MHAGDPRPPDAAAVRALHLEADPAEGERVERELRRLGRPVEILRIASRDEFVRALDAWRPDVVLGDDALPGLDGPTALALLRERHASIPFVSVSGPTGETRAVELLRDGAAGFVLKGRLDELPAAVLRALAESVERRRLADAEQELREREEQYRALVEELPGVLYVARPDEVGSPVYVGPQIEAVLGYTQEEWIADPGLRARALHAEDRDRVLAELAVLRAGARTLDVEYRLVAKDGRAVWFHDRARMVSMGEILIRGILTDVTERKRLEEQFLQSQKMEVVGRLAGGVAHDFNNLITVITGYGDLLLGRLAPDDPNRPWVQEMYDAGLRAANLTRQLLAFSRRQLVERRAVDPNAVVSGLAKLLGRLVGDDVELLTSPGKEVDRVLADAGQLEQVLVNLVVNARDAMPKGGRITIETRNTDEAEEFVEGRRERRPGSHVQLTVRDTGSGIPPEVCRRLFEPFFTTKAPGKGTGLGLSTVQAIVRASGGFVSVETEPGKGSAFSIFLPPAAGEALAGTASVPAAETSRGSETILVAEDSEILLRLTRQILRSAGYTVLCSRDGEEALRMFQERKVEIDLVLADTVMPGLSGPELVRRVIRERPGVRILLMSGYSERAAAEEGLRVAELPFLQKPFNAEKLTRRVREVLESSAPAAC